MPTPPQAKPPDAVLKRTLTPIQDRVTQRDGTEPPFRNGYRDHHADGIHVDVVSGEPLFRSRDTYDSGTGWPSFTRPLLPGNLVERQDRGWLGLRSATPRRSDRAAAGATHPADRASWREPSREHPAARGRSPLPGRSMRPLHVAATAVLLAVTAPPTLASAQSATHPLIGTWTMDVPAGMRLGPSGPEAVRGSGTLVVRQEGDSLIGLLDVPPPAGFPAVPPRRFAAALRPGTVTLERRSTATIAGPDGGENAVPALTQLQLTVDGDRLSGTQDSAVEGLLQLGASPQPVSGTRQGGR